MYPELGNIEIGHQAPIGGFQPPPVTTYPMAQPSYPTSYPATQYPQAGIGNQQYPEGGGISNYPPAVQPFGAPPPGMYPPTGGYAGSSYPPPVSTPSLTGNNFYSTNNYLFLSFKTLLFFKD